MVSDIQPLLLHKSTPSCTPFTLHFSSDWSLGLEDNAGSLVEGVMITPTKGNLKAIWPLVIRHCTVMRDDGLLLYATECDIQKDGNLLTSIFDWRSRGMLAMIREGIDPQISCPLLSEGASPVPLETFARRCEHEDEHSNVTMQVAGLVLTWISRDEDGDTYDLVKGRCTKAKSESERVRFATVSGLRTGSKPSSDANGERVTLTMLVDESMGLMRYCVIATVLLASGVV